MTPERKEEIRERAECPPVSILALALGDYYFEDVPDLLAARVKAEQDWSEYRDGLKDRITALEAERDALKERENITDELMASQYRAGAQAGWNAAQLDDPAASKAIASLTEFKKGDLHHVRAANARRALESSHE